MKVSPLPKRHQDYIDRVTWLSKQIYETVPRRKPILTQAPSMQAIIDRDPSLDKEHWNRPVPLLAQVNTLENIDDMPAWSGNVKDVAIVENIRRRSKNTIGDAVSEGARSTTEQSRERAMHAYVYTPSANPTSEQLKTITKLNTIKSMADLIDEHTAILQTKTSIFKKILNAFGLGKKNKPTPDGLTIYKALGGKESDFD